MREYRNFIILGSLFAICAMLAIHGSHDGDEQLLVFSLDSAKEILAAILTIMTITASGQRKTDAPPEEKHDVLARSL
jgi:hypothetical protein